jgi:hypothetical protein
MDSNTNSELWVDGKGNKARYGMMTAFRSLVVSTDQAMEEAQSGAFTARFERNGALRLLAVLRVR